MSGRAPSTLRVVDPHIHLWDTRVVSYPWLANPAVAYSGDNRLLPQHYDVAEYLTDAQDFNVLGTVSIEGNPLDPVAEAQWLQSLADNPANGGQPSGIVAYADLSRDNAPTILARLSAFPNVRGIRQILNRHANPRYNYVTEDYLSNPTWRENLRWLADYGWSFDLQIYPAQARSAAEVIDANPEVTFIINHTGMFVDRSHVKGWREWRDALRRLADCENSAIKLSGLAMFDHHWTVESFRPLVLEAIDCFGHQRCMFASNFPIDRLQSSYRSLWSAYAQIVSEMDAHERENLFVKNAARYYRLAAVEDGAGSIARSSIGYRENAWKWR
jgi:predicted TIM-barrel fold metal-dependent hydrolase